MAEWKRATDTAAYPTLEDWIANEARGGRKLDGVMFAVGDSMRATITWTNGKVEQLIVADTPEGVRVTFRRDVEASPEPVPVPLPEPPPNS